MRGKQLIIIQPFPFVEVAFLKFTKPFSLHHQDEPKNNVQIAYMSSYDRELNATLSAREVDDAEYCILKLMIS